MELAHAPHTDATQREQLLLAAVAYVAALALPAITWRESDKCSPSFIDGFIGCGECWISKGPGHCRVFCGKVTAKLVSAQSMHVQNEKAHSTLA